MPVSFIPQIVFYKKFCKGSIDQNASIRIVSISPLKKASRGCLTSKSCRKKKYWTVFVILCLLFLTWTYLVGIYGTNCGLMFCNYCKGLMQFLPAGVDIISLTLLCTYVLFRHWIFCSWKPALNRYQTH